MQDKSLSADAAEAAAGYVEEEEGAAHRLSGHAALMVTALAVAMSLFHLYAAYGIVPATVLRPVHVGFVLALAFLSFPVAARVRDHLLWWDWALAAAAATTIVYIVAGGDAYADRATVPSSADLVVGVTLILLVLEAVRRASGWIMPAVVLGFIVYAMMGPYLPPPWTHRGYDIARLVGHMVMTLEGIFGPAVDVSSTLIILFTIFGAFLAHSGAGKFFIDFSVAAMGKRRNGAGRSVVLSSFLLGGASGSGVATTVTLGSVAYPMLAKAGYGKDSAGGLLAAGGLGAILCPPVLGAAAFLIAEFLKISYLEVIRMAAIPACLYYLSLFLMVEFDGRRFGRPPEGDAVHVTALRMLRASGFYFLPLIAVVALLLAGFSPVLAVFWATAVAWAVSFLNRESALVPRKLINALAAGSSSVLNVAATCAAAGIIVGVVTLTGLGLKFSSIVVGYAGGNLLLTALFTALVVWVVGLAVPVTASYIICAVIAAPALIHVGVPDFAAHMFVFYYAVLSEVSPPTALSPFAAAAITGGDPYRTTLQSWKYTLPAFLIPFMFVLDPAGVGLLLKGSLGQTFVTVVSAVIGIAALAGGVQNWLLIQANRAERLMLIAAGLLLVYPGVVTDSAGLVLIVAVVLMQKLRR
ncbi:MAG TPA: TRAP transporter fused permease subunit [Burkholderiales bacterium]|jgi:TRAP transporter 4TM/12TM fusion protein|nr:TRAP transporter fused permease subunit [Burkholderiales bacterium]